MLQLLLSLHNLLRRSNICRSSSRRPELDPLILAEITLEPYAEQQRHLLMIRLVKCYFVLCQQSGINRDPVVQLRVERRLRLSKIVIRGRQPNERT